MKRVLFVDHVDRVLGGAEINLIELIEEAQKHHEWQIAVACRKGSLLSKGLASLNVQQYDYGFGEGLNTLRFAGRQFPWAGINSGLRALKASAGILEKIIDQFKPTAAISCTNKDHFASVRACAKSGLKSFWWVNDLITHEFFPYPARLAFRRYARAAHGLVAVSNTVAESLQFAGAKVRVIQNGIPVKKYTGGRTGALRSRISVPDDQPLFGMIGRICEWKGQDIFLTLAQLWISDDKPGHFVVVGKAFNEDHAFERRIREMGVRQHKGIHPTRNIEAELPKRVHFVPFLPDVSAALGDLDALVHMATKPEPFGRVIIEAMAAGVPVIAAKAGGPAEIIRDGVNGFLAELSYEEYFAALKRVYPRTAAIEKALAAARATVSERFTVERVYREFDALLSLT